MPQWIDLGVICSKFIKVECMSHYDYRSCWSCKHFKEIDNDWMCEVEGKELERKMQLGKINGGQTTL